MVIDCHDELKAAWKAIVRAGGPEAVPDAMALLRELPFGYHECSAAADDIGSPVRRIERTREWAAFFRDRYDKARKAAQRVSGNDCT